MCLSRARLLIVVGASLLLLLSKTGWTVAAISSQVESGEPCGSGTLFDVVVRVDGNTDGPIGTYAITVRWDARLTLVGSPSSVPEDGLSGSPTFSGTGSTRNVSAFDAASTLINGRLFRLRFVAPTPALAGNVSLITELADFGATALAGTNLRLIPHVYDTSGTSLVCGEPATPTPTFTSTPSQTPLSGDAIVEAVVESGSPCAEGGLFDLAVRVRNNPVGPVGTYALTLTWNPALTLISAPGAVPEDGFHGAPSANGIGNSLNVSAIDANSTLVNGRLFRMSFAAPSPAFDVATDLIANLEDFGITALVSTSLAVIPHQFDLAAVSGMCDPNATATPTNTASSTATPTPTATGACGRVLYGDVSGDNRVSAIDAALILQYDALIIDCFPIDTNCDGYGPED